MWRTQIPRILMFGPSVDGARTNIQIHPSFFDITERIIDKPEAQICSMRHYSDVSLYEGDRARMSSSCYTCRRRRIECAMTGPPCTKCEKAGLECFQKRPLRWVAGAEFRGKAKRTGASAVAANVRANHVRSRTVDNAEYHGASESQLCVLSSSDYGGRNKCTINTG